MFQNLSLPYSIPFQKSRTTLAPKLSEFFGSESKYMSPINSITYYAKQIYAESPLSNLYKYNNLFGQERSLSSSASFTHRYRGGNLNYKKGSILNYKLEMTPMLSKQIYNSPSTNEVGYVIW